MKCHLGSNIYVLNLFNALTDASAPVQKLIDKSHLNYFNYKDSEGLIPIKVMYNFFEIVQKDQHIDNLAATFGDYYHMDKIGAYGEFLASSNLILSCIQKAIANEPNSLSYTDIKLNLDSDGAFISNRYVTESSIGQEVLSNIEMGIYLRVLKLANEKDWSPQEIHVTGPDISQIEYEFPNHHAEILLNQPRLWCKIRYHIISASFD